jgi:hypothetical protein
LNSPKITGEKFVGVFGGQVVGGRFVVVPPKYKIIISSEIGNCEIFNVSNK